MMGVLRKHKFLFLIGIVVIAGVAWFAMSGGTPSGDAVLTTTTPPSGAAGSAQRQLLSTLNDLRSIRLGAEILNDPAFLSLRDFGTDIITEPIGRRNPFAPLGSSSSGSGAAQ
jgi:hypothetical protein